MSDSPDKSILNTIFKAYDIRGKVGTELNEQTAKSVGKAFADWLPSQGKIAVGRDMRPDSYSLSRSLIEGLRSQGRDVIDIGQVTSDMIYFAVGHYGLAGGAVITASHNPGEYNGIKLCREEAKPVGEPNGLFEIRDNIINNSYKETPQQGSLEDLDIDEEWIDHCLSFIEPDKLLPLKIVVDAGNGMAGKTFPKLEGRVPFKVHEMYFELDGTFPNHVANPVEPENLKDLQKAVKENDCDVGIAFDGDGDRAVLVDEKGEPLSGTVMTAMLAEYFLEKNPGATILYNAVCGRIVPESIERKGGISKKTRVGHSFIKEEMHKSDAVFAGETSGHYYFKDNFMADSGMIAAVIALYIISLSGKKVSELAEPYRKAYFEIPEANFEVADKEYVLKKVSEAFKDDKQDWLDGLTVSFKNSWFNVRPSNTEPLLRLNVEAKTKDELDELVTKVTQIIQTP